MKLFSLFFLRISLGSLFFYAGSTKVLDPSWSAAGYLMNAKTFSGLYTWFASADILPSINFVNECLAYRTLSYTRYLRANKLCRRAILAPLLLLILNG